MATLGSPLGGVRLSLIRWWWVDMAMDIPILKQKKHGKVDFWCELIGRCCWVWWSVETRGHWVGVCVNWFSRSFQGTFCLLARLPLSSSFFWGMPRLRKRVILYRSSNVSIFFTHQNGWDFIDRLWVAFAEYHLCSIVCSLFVNIRYSAFPPSPVSWSRWLTTPRDRQIG